MSFGLSRSKSIFIHSICHCWNSKPYNITHYGSNCTRNRPNLKEMKKSLTHSQMLSLIFNPWIAQGSYWDRTSCSMHEMSEESELQKKLTLCFYECCSNKYSGARIQTSTCITWVSRKPRMFAIWTYFVMNIMQTIHWEIHRLSHRALWFQKILILCLNYKHVLSRTGV